MGSEVSERKSRQVAESAREQEWSRPSFGRGLFLGRFDLGLVHPYPRQTPAAVEKGEAFLRRLETFLRTQVDGLQIEADDKIPDRVVKGLAEPAVGSDPARLSATAVPTEDGSAYMLNGVKLWTTNGTIARVMVVMAEVPESAGHPGGISAFVVERDMKGVKIVRRNHFMGLRGIENALID